MKKIAIKKMTHGRVVAIAVEAGMDIVVSLTGSAVDLHISPFLYESLWNGGLK